MVIISSIDVQNVHLCVSLAEMILVGVFGGRKADGHISSIGFVRLDMSPSTNTPAEIFGELHAINHLPAFPSGNSYDYLGPFGSSSPPCRSFGTYGHIIAFIGSDNNESSYSTLLD